MDTVRFASCDDIQILENLLYTTNSHSIIVSDEQ